VSDHWPFLQSKRDIHVTGAEGAYLFTKDGPLLDAAGGAIVVNIGHGRQEVASAVGKATMQSSYVVPPWLTDERIALVERLREDWLPESLSRLHMTSGGSEAVESAMKIAIMHHASRGQAEKCRIISRSISYHGTTLATTAVGGHEARKVGIAHVLNPHPVVPTQTRYITSSKNSKKPSPPRAQRRLRRSSPNPLLARVAVPSFLLTVIGKPYAESATKTIFC